MQPPEILYLTQQEVIDTGVGLDEATDLITRVLIEHGEGRYENPPKPGVHPLPDSFIHAMPGYLTGLDLCGMKWVSGFFGNPRSGLPSISGLIVLNDPQTGFPIAVMDAAYITAVRTAAISGVAARFLAREDAELLGIVGAGVQGRYNLITLARAVPGLQRARVFDTDSGALAHFCSAMPEHVGLRVEPASSARDALEGADLLVTATGQLHSVEFSADWVCRGALVLPVHSAGWEPAIIREADKFVVDDWQQFRSSLGGPDGFYGEMPTPHAQLGEIVAGVKPGRERDDERIISFNYGMAIQDIGMASEVLRRARERGMGILLEQLDGTMPFLE